MLDSDYSVLFLMPPSLPLTSLPPSLHLSFLVYLSVCIFVYYDLCTEARDSSDVGIHGLHYLGDFLLLLLRVILFRVDVIGKPGRLICEDWLFPVHFPCVTWTKPCLLVI